MAIVLWPAVAGACLMLAAISLAVWVSDRARVAYLSFACFALGLVGLAAAEVLMMRAQTIEQFASAQRWAHVPLFVVIVAIVWFVWSFLGTGRLWLAWTVCAVRFVSLVANFSTGVSLNYVEITALRQVPLWDGELISAAVGKLNPWMITGQLSVLLLVIYVIDAALRAARQANRDLQRRALIVGGSIVLSVVVATGLTLLVLLGVQTPPYIIAPIFFLTLLAMSFELSADVVRADRLGRALRLSDAELRESKERMDLASVAAGLGLWQWVPGRDEVSITGTGRELFGFAADERVSLDGLLSRVHPDDRDALRQGIDAALRRGDLYEQEFRIVLPDRGMRWIASRGRVDARTDGSDTLIRVVSFDVTERRQFAQALAESGERFRAMADAAPVMLWMAGPDKLCTFFNRTWLEFTGRTLDQELGDGWAEGIHPEDAERCLRSYGESFDTRRDFTLEYRLRRNDGEYRWIIDNGTPRFAADGAFVGYIGSCLDVTDLKRAEQRMRLVFEAWPNALVMVDEAGNVALANERVEAVFGYRNEELIGRSVEMLVPVPLRLVHQALRSEYWQNPVTREIATGRELYGKRKDGSEVPLEIGLTPIHTNEGTFILASIADISERRRAEVEMAHQRSELAYLSRVNLLGTLSGSLAHELNQPLTAILSNAQAALRFLAREPAEIEELRDILEDIVEDDKRAGEVIRRLRTLFRKEEPRHESVDVNEVVQDVMGLMRSDFVNRGVRVDVDLAPDLPQVIGDKIQFEQVLLNLILNGCEAMVGLRDRAARLEVRTRRAGDRIEVTVTDHGRGIAAADMERLFEPFFTTKPLGMGLGLAVCQQIMESHGGHLAAANVAGGGATFSVGLPAAAGDDDR